MFYNLKDKKPQNLGENWVAPNATIIGDVSLEKNSSVWFNAVLRGDIENIQIGEGSNVQDGCVLHTDPGYPLKIGKNVTVGHMVMLHGCLINDNSLIGIGAVLLNGSKIGKNCLIGPFCSIPAGVQLEDEVELLSHVALSGQTFIGSKTKIWPFSSIGHQPQDLKFKNERPHNSSRVVTFYRGITFRHFSNKN